MSTSDENPEENKKKPKKYLWFGYGSYSGETGAFHPTNIRADPSIFDKLFELFHVNGNTKKRGEEKDADKVR